MTLPGRDGMVVRLDLTCATAGHPRVVPILELVALVRIAVVVVLVASGLVVLYGLILDRSGQNIAFTVAGLAVLGLTLAFISAWFLTRALTDARWGRTGRLTARRGHGRALRDRRGRMPRGRVDLRLHPRLTERTRRTLGYTPPVAGPHRLEA